MMQPVGKGNPGRAFSIALPSSEVSPVDVLGLWEPAPPAGFKESARNAGSPGVLFHAELPADPDLAFDLLDARAHELQTASQAFPTAELRLTSDLSQLAAISGAGGASFSTVENDAALAVLAAGMQHQGLGVSFGLLDGVKIDPFQLEQAANTASAFAEQVRRTVDQLALVETACAGHRLGFTRAAWSGDVETWWSAAATRAQRLQHEQVLAQALATRQGWLRFLLLVAGGIPRVAAALAAGPFSLVTVWTTWNYLQEVVKTYQRLSKG